MRMTRYGSLTLLLSVSLWPGLVWACDQGDLVQQRPENFVSLADIGAEAGVRIPVIGVYADSDNFLGESVNGYEDPICLLARPAAMALVNAQQQLSGSGLSLLIFDCYRPQQAVDHFMAWADAGADDDDDSDDAEKSRYYPKFTREDLIDDVYIAECSGHSRGSTVDLTIVYQPGSDGDIDSEHLLGCDASFDGRPKGIDMGTGFDCFDPTSHTENRKQPFHVLENRRMLKRLMESAGFRNYEKEWWHYTLKDEPYPETRFDFPVE